MSTKENKHTQRQLFMHKLFRNWLMCENGCSICGGHGSLNLALVVGRARVKARVSSQICWLKLDILLNFSVQRILSNYYIRHMQNKKISG